MKKQNENTEPAITSNGVFKMYELDFGDTNLITENKKDILNWIEADLDNIDENGLQYEITTKLMTREEIDALPEWA
jgi:hypothetical protein